MLVGMVQELARYRGLLGMLAWRDIRVRYKQSLLGVAWAFLVPILQTAVLYAIFSFGPVRIGADQINGMNYLLFVLSGVVPWTFFAGALNSSIDSLTRNARLLTKIYFPREVFPLASVTGALVDLGLASLVVVPFWAWSAMRGEVAAGPVLLLLPVVLLIQVLLVAGLALILSMANLFFRDVKYVMAFALQLWFFATNVVYPIRFENHPQLAWIAAVNPMIAIIDAYRDILVGGPLQNVGGLLLAAATALVLFVMGWRLFHRAEARFAEYV